MGSFFCPSLTLSLPLLPTKLSEQSAQAADIINLNGVLLTSNAIDELQTHKEDQNFSIEAHTDALSEVTSFFLLISNEINHRDRDELNACRALNFVRDSIIRLKTPAGREVHHD